MGVSFLSLFGSIRLAKMTSRHVQVSAPPDKSIAQPQPALRRRPRQRRAQASSAALQQAFVRVLLERGYAKATIREIAAVAGVSVGTFYEYFGDKESLAALTIHHYVKTLATRMRAVVDARRGECGRAVAAALIDAQVDAIEQDPRVWAAMFAIERTVSPIDAYRRHYDDYVALWRDALAGASDAPADARLDVTARVAHALCYGWVSQSLLTQGAKVDVAQLRDELHRAAGAYLAAAMDGGAGGGAAGG